MRRLKSLILVCAVAAVAAAPASASAAAPADFVGIVAEDTFRLGQPANDAAFARKQSAGVTLIRQTFDWAHIEYKPGLYDWGTYDQFVGAAARRGIRVLPIIFHPPSFRSSAPRRGAKRGTYFPKRLADMGDFGAVLAARYGVDGIFWKSFPSIPKMPMTAYQVWNEPNLPVYDPPRPNPRDYVALLKATAAGIRAVDPNAEIVTAGLPDSKLSRPGNVYKYIASMYKAGARDAFDTLAINPYGRNSRAVLKKLNRVRKIMHRYRDAEGKIWATELGWSDVGPRAPQRAGRKGQAKQIRKTIAALNRNRAKLNLRGFVYYAWRDGRVYSKKVGDFWGLHTGLLRLNGSAKPAFKAFARAVAAL